MQGARFCFPTRKSVPTRQSGADHSPCPSTPCCHHRIGGKGGGARPRSERPPQQHPQSTAMAMSTATAARVASSIHGHHVHVRHQHAVTNTSAASDGHGHARSGRHCDDHRPRPGHFHSTAGAGRATTVVTAAATRRGGAHPRRRSRPRPRAAPDQRTAQGGRSSGPGRTWEVSPRCQ